MSHAPICQYGDCEKKPGGRYCEEHEPRYTIAYSPGMADAAVYRNGKLERAGHTEDVSEWLIEQLGVEQIHVDFVTDKTAGGWNGVAKNLSDIEGL